MSAAAYRNVKIQGLWELKQGFVMAVVSRPIRYIRECPLRKRLQYDPQMTASMRSEYLTIIPRPEWALSQ